MIYLIWGLLNIGLLLYFLIICFKAAKMLKQKVGLFPAVFFVFGLFSSSGQQMRGGYDSEVEFGQSKLWSFSSEDGNAFDATYLLSEELDKNWMFKKRLVIKYAEDVESHIKIPISAFSSTTGLVSGVIWKPISIRVNKDEANNGFEYFVHGVDEWRLFGVKLYTQNKSYNATAVIGQVISN